MKTESFDQRPTADMVLNMWYQIRDTLPEDKMEDLHLRPRQQKQQQQQQSASGAHVRCPSDDSTGATGGSRSNKRDIPSILNKVNSFFIVIYILTF